MAKGKAKAKAPAKGKAPIKAPAKGTGTGKGAVKAKAPAKAAPVTVREILRDKPKFKKLPTVQAGPAKVVAMAPAVGRLKSGKSNLPPVAPVAIPAQVLPIGDAEGIAPEVAAGMDQVAAGVLAGVDPQAQAQALADWVAPHPVGVTVRVPIDTVDMNPAHNGRVLDPAKVKEYAADYAKRIAAGTEPQLQECTGFYPRGENRLRLVFGFHRAAAVKALNDKNAKMVVAAALSPMQLRVRIVDDMSTYNALLDNWAENKHHNALTPVAEMRYMVRLRDDHKLEQKAIAKTLGVSPTLVSLRLLLERLDPGVLALVEDGTIPVKSAYMLAGIEDGGKRAAAVAKVAAVFAGLGDAGVVKGLKLPKTAIVAQAVAEATGQAPADGGGADGGGGGVDGDGDGNGNPQAPAPVAADPAPKRLAVGKIESALVEVVKAPKTPTEVKTVLRAVLGWVLGQRTQAAMVNTVAKALGYDPKTLNGPVAAAGAGAEPLPVEAQAPVVGAVPAVGVGAEPLPVEDGQ